MAIIKKLIAMMAVVLVSAAPCFGACTGGTCYAHHTVNNDGDCNCEPTGTGAGPCSAQQVADCAVAGDLINIETGTYTLAAAIDWDTNAGTAVAPITIRNSGGAVLFDGDGAATHCWNITSAADYLDVKGIDFTNSTGGPCVYIAQGGDYHRWEDNDFYSCGEEGLESNSRYSNFFDLLGYSNTLDNLRFAMTNQFVANSLARDGSAGGFFVVYEGVVLYRVIAENNAFEGVDIHANADNTWILDSVFRGNGVGNNYSAIDIDDTTLWPSAILNCIMEGSTDYAIASTTDYTGNNDYNVTAWGNWSNGNTDGDWSNINCGLLCSTGTAANFVAADNHEPQESTLVGAGYPASDPDGVMTVNVTPGYCEVDDPAGGGGGAPILSGMVIQ